MKIHQHPELLERLASSYALGTLRGGARRRFEAMAREQAPVRAAAIIWQSRLASLNELQPQAQPSTAVWTRIDNLVQGEFLDIFLKLIPHYLSFHLLNSPKTRSEHVHASIPQKPLPSDPLRL